MKALAIGIVFFAAVVAFAGDVEEGDAAILKGDYVLALKKYKVEAEKGNDDAQNSVGDMYFTGYKGVPQNYREAIRWYKLSAAQGNARSQFSLGSMYQEGQSVIQDYAEAARLYKLSASQGLPIAQMSLGMLYWEGIGVTHDLVRAHMWMNLSAAQSDRNQHLLQSAMKFREKIEKALPTKELAKAQTMARECLQRNYKNCD